MFQESKTNYSSLIEGRVQFVEGDLKDWFLDSLVPGAWQGLDGTWIDNFVIRVSLRYEKIILLQTKKQFFTTEKKNFLTLKINFYYYIQIPKHCV